MSCSSRLHKLICTYSEADCTLRLIVLHLFIHLHPCLSLGHSVELFSPYFWSSACLFAHLFFFSYFLHFFFCCLMQFCLDMRYNKHTIITCTRANSFFVLILAWRSPNAVFFKLAHMHCSHTIISFSRWSLFSRIDPFKGVGAFVLPTFIVGLNLSVSRLPAVLLRNAPGNLQEGDELEGDIGVSPRGANLWESQGSYPQVG